MNSMRVKIITNQSQGFYSSETKQTKKPKKTPTQTNPKTPVLYFFSFVVWGPDSASGSAPCWDSWLYSITLGEGVCDPEDGCAPVPLTGTGGKGI